MTDPELVELLHQMGIDRASFRVLSLMPLVQVAWADGPITDQERKVILDVAERGGTLGGEGLRVLENWLSFAPSEETVTRGHHVLSALLHTPEKAGAQLAEAHPEMLLDHCIEVAKATRKLFGLLPNITDAERQAMEDIRQALANRGSAPADFDDPDPTDVLDLEAIRRGLSSSMTIVGTGDEGEARLVQLQQDGRKGTVIPIVGELKVGRGPGNHLKIDHDGGVSRNHCTIRFDEGSYYLTDHRSTNGTRVNGDLVRERRLFGGERITIGAYHFCFELEG